MFLKKKKFIKKLVKEDLNKGKFLVMEGDIDRREEELKDVTLHPGFSVECGIRGNKLSGG